MDSITNSDTSTPLILLYFNKAANPQMEEGKNMLKYLI